MYNGVSGLDRHKEVVRGALNDPPIERQRLTRVWRTIRVASYGITLDYMRFGQENLRPLIFLNSLEYPGAPTWGFCVDAAAAGFGVLALRRPGFGRSDPLPDLARQADLIEAFLEEQGIANAVLVGIGSGNPVAYRLALRSRRVALSLFTNPVFNRDVMREFRPAWFGELLGQTLRSEAGARVSLGAMRQLGKRFGAQWIYSTCLQKSPGDISFVRENPADADEAWALASAISVRTFRAELLPSLKGDPILTDQCFASIRAFAVSGTETTPTWKEGFEAEANRLGLPVHYLPSGDVLAAFASGPQLLDFIRRHA